MSGNGGFPVHWPVKVGLVAKRPGRGPLQDRGWGCSSVGWVSCVSGGPSLTPCEAMDFSPRVGFQLAQCPVLWSKFDSLCGKGFLSSVCAATECNYMHEHLRTWISKYWQPYHFWTHENTAHPKSTFEDRMWLPRWQEKRKWSRAVCLLKNRGTTTTTTKCISTALNPCVIHV